MGYKMYFVNVQRCFDLSARCSHESVNVKQVWSEVSTVLLEPK